MSGDISIAEKIYIACGYTDMRKSIDGLVTLVQSRFEMNLFEPVLFIFCGRRCDRIKALVWEGDGFVLLYKRLANGKFQWTRSKEELMPIIWQQFRWLMEGLQLEQKKVIRAAKIGSIY